MKESILGYSLMIFVSLSTAFGTKFAISSRPLPLLASTTVSWLAYTDAHKKFTGKAIHSSDEHITIRGADTKTRKIGLSIGLILCLIAFPICIVGVHYSNIIYLASGYLTFFTGYLTAHYNWFGNFL